MRNVKHNLQDEKPTDQGEMTISIAVLWFLGLFQFKLLSVGFKIIN